MTKKAIILVGGPKHGMFQTYHQSNFDPTFAISLFILITLSYSYLNTGSQFRPLSLKCPMPLFPVAGTPLVMHHIRALKTAKIDEIILLGVFIGMN